MADSFITSQLDQLAHIDADPGADLIYTQDWNLWLLKAGAGRTIASAIVAAQAGLTVVGIPGTTAGLVSQRLRFNGTTVGNAYTVTYKITADDGEKDERTFVIHIKDR